MMLENFFVAGESIDSRQPGTLHEQTPDGDRIRSFKSRNEIGDVLFEIERACIHQPQNSRRCELHGHGSNVEARANGVPDAPLTVGEAVSLLKHYFSLLRNENVPRQVSIADIRLKIPVDGCRHQITLTSSLMSTRCNYDCNSEHPHRHTLRKYCQSGSGEPAKIGPEDNR